MGAAEPTLWGRELWCCAVLTALWPLDETVQAVAAKCHLLRAAATPRQLTAVVDRLLEAGGAAAIANTVPVAGLIEALIMTASIVLIRQSHLNREQVQQVMQLVCFDTVRGLVLSPLYQAETGRYDRGAGVN